MKRLERASGYFQYFNPDTGLMTEGETRQCIHCGFTWIYDPGAHFKRKLGLTSLKPMTRGTCIKCSGVVCAQDACLKDGCRSFQQKIEDAERKSASNILLKG